MGGTIGASEKEPGKGEGDVTHVRSLLSLSAPDTRVEPTTRLGEIVSDDRSVCRCVFDAIGPSAKHDAPQSMGQRVPIVY